MELLSAHLVEPVSRKPNTKLKGKSAFRFYVCKIYKITNSAMGISYQHICIFNNPVGKVDHLSGLSLVALKRAVVVFRVSQEDGTA